jgi:hypothetical protein
MKAIVYFAMVLLLAGFAVAGSIDDLDYKDRGFLGQDTNRQIDDHSVTIDADTLDGQTAGDILDDANDYTDDAVNDEATDRENADDDLQDNIDDETSARQTADNTEKTQRQNADNSEKAQRQIGDAVLGMGIIATNIGSINRDNNLQNNIDDEANDRATGDDTINQMIDDSRDEWTKDEVGGGITSWWVSRLLVGYLPDKASLWDDYDNFMDYAKGIFATKDRVTELEDRVTKLETEIDILKEMLAVNIDDQTIEARVGLTESEDTGEPVHTDSGFVCDANIGDCLKVTPVEAPPATETPEDNTQALLDLYNHRLELLKTWQPLCDKNVGAWCDIIAKRKAEWGMI